jgi:3-keto-disaccharide hydrolase
MSNRLISGIVLLGLLCVCAVSAQTPGVSAAEQKEGFKAIFDGQSLKGWTPRPPPAGRGATEPPATGKWAAQSGELVWVKDSGRGYLLTDQVYTDFTLRLDFFADAPANTGVNFGIPDTGNISSQTSFEVNIFDDTDQFPTGSINNVQRTSVAKPKTIDKWNSMEVTRQADHITIVLNGEKVLDAKSPLHPGGHIGLQAPAMGTTKFRNLRIKTS